MRGIWLTHPVARIALITLFGCGSVVAHEYFSPSLIAAISKTAAVFIGTVWVTVMAFALKVSDITEAPTLSPGEHEALELKARGAVKRVWLYAGLNAIAAIFVLLPSILVEAKEQLNPWVVVIAASAIGFSVHSIIVHAWWQEELRRFRSSLRERERTEQYYARLAEATKSDEPLLTPEDQASLAALNTKIDWPGTTKH